MKNALKVITAIAGLCIANQASATIHSYTVPWFSGPDIGVADGEQPDPGFVDFGGASWRHHRNAPWNNYATMRTQQWSSVRLRWESTSGVGSSEAFQDGPLQNGTQPTLWSGGDQADATMMFAPAPPVAGGLYSFDGTLELVTSGTIGGTRAQVVHYDAAGNPNVLYTFSSSSDTGNQSIDFGAEAALQNILVFPGDHLGFGFRKVSIDGTAEGLLYGADPVTITGDVIPEPSSITLIVLGTTIAAFRMRRR
jgi:hypothetical protein